MLILGAFSLHGCISIHYEDAARNHHVVGFSFTAEEPSQSGHHMVIRSPGVSLRLCTHASGVSLGWHTEELFEVSEPERGTVAVGQSNLGVGLCTGALCIGYFRTLGIELPESTKSQFQEFHFSESAPDRTVIRREPVDD